MLEPSIEVGRDSSVHFLTDMKCKVVRKNWGHWCLVIMIYVFPLPDMCNVVVLKMLREIRIVLPFPRYQCPHPQLTIII